MKRQADDEIPSTEIFHADKIRRLIKDTMDAIVEEATRIRPERPNLTIQGYDTQGAQQLFDLRPAIKQLRKLYWNFGGTLTSPNVVPTPHQQQGTDEQQQRQLLTIEELTDKVIDNRANFYLDVAEDDYGNILNGFFEGTFAPLTFRAIIDFNNDRQYRFVACDGLYSLPFIPMVQDNSVGQGAMVLDVVKMQRILTPTYLTIREIIRMWEGEIPTEEGVNSMFVCHFVNRNHAHNLFSIDMVPRSDPTVNNLYYLFLMCLHILIGQKQFIDISGDVIIDKILKFNFVIEFRDSLSNAKAYKTFSAVNTMVINENDDPDTLYRKLQEYVTGHMLAEFGEWVRNMLTDERTDFADGNYGVFGSLIPKIGADDTTSINMSNNVSISKINVLLFIAPVFGPQNKYTSPSAPTFSPDSHLSPIQHLPPIPEEFSLHDNNNFFEEPDVIEQYEMERQYEEEFYGCYASVIHDESYNEFQKLLRHQRKTNYIYEPKEQDGLCFQNCMKKKGFNDTTLKNKKFCDITTIEDFAKRNNVCIHIFQGSFVNPNSLLRKFCYYEFVEKVYGLANSTKHVFLFSYKIDNIVNHVLLIDTPTKDWLSFKKCNVCHKYFGDIIKHHEKCKLCQCGQIYKEGGPHKSRCRITNPRKRISITNKDDGLGLKQLNCNEQLDEKNFTDEKNVYFVDFEAFHDNIKGSHNVYAVGLLRCDYKAPKLWLGVNALEDFIKYIMNPKNKVYGTIYFYNGSAYDVYLLLNKYFTCYENPKFAKDAILFKGSRILSFKIKSRPQSLVIKDLYLMTMCSLNSACKGFAVDPELSKGEFDHSLITNFLDVEFHRENITEYLSKDVLSMKEIYKKYNKIIQDSFKLNMTKYISLSHMCHNIWQTMLTKDIRIFTTNKEVDDWIRKGYFGGRVAPQIKKFTSQMYYTCFLEQKRNGHVSENTFDKIGDDYLCYTDVVSLYPSQMKKRLFPCGVMTQTAYSDVDGKLLADSITTLILKTGKGEARNILKDFMYRSILEVDVECPKDILTPFLMSRDEKTKKLKFDLHDKIKQVYTGCELVEAIRLGYKITQVHKLLSFKDRKDIFSKYINICFEGKKKAGDPDQWPDNKKNTALYAIYKLLMNALSGKHAQKVITKDISIVNPDDMDIHALVHDKQSEVKILQTRSNGLITKVLLARTREKARPTHATYLSVFILSWARVHMSSILRKMNGYKDIRNMFYYQDTDSYILNATTYKKFQKNYPHLTRDNLGNLADEFQGGKVLYIRVLAPKTYGVVYLTKPKDGQCELKYKCVMKGIPHTSEMLDPTIDHSTQLKLAKTKRFTENFVDLKKHVYKVTYTDKKKATMSREYSAFITPYMLNAVLKGNCVIKCYYATLRRMIQGKGEEAFIVYPQIVSRILVRQNWWDNGSRETLKNYVDEDEIIPNNSITVPCGYYLLNKN